LGHLRPAGTSLVTGDRFRHGTTFLRWRPDKTPAGCELAQIAAGAEAMLLFEAAGSGR
jgi:hypothetical protein